MIHISVRENAITVVGHANYDEYGKDIVCAGVSSLVQTLALRGRLEKLKGDIVIVWSDDKQALKLITEGLKQVANNYPNYVEVIDV